MNTSSNKPYYLIRGEFSAKAGAGSEPSKEEVYMLAAEIQDKEDMSFKRSIYCALLSYDYYYYYDYDYYYEYDYDYYSYGYYYYYYGYYYYYDYDYDSKEQKVIALLFLATIYTK